MRMNLQVFTKGAPGKEPREKKAPERQGPTVEDRLAKLEALFLSREEGKEEPKEGSGYLATLREKEEERQKQEAHKALVDKLKAQEQEAKQLYPNLSLEEEGKNPNFVELLKCGLDVRSAFEVIHKDEIIAASMEYAAREVERMMTNKILAGGIRPVENGGNHGPAVTKTDVKSMTRQERKDLIRRVRAGEKITL